MKFDTGDDDSREYEVEAIRDSTVYVKELNEVIYQVSLIWSHEKDIQRKKIPESQL